MLGFFRRVFGHPATTHSVVGAVMAAAAYFISGWEGYSGKTYNDIVGVPTVCYGETDAAAVKAGRERELSKDECRQMLAKSLEKYDRGMRACLHKPITDNMHVAFLSTTYNIGIAGFCKSSMARLVNEGKPREACDALEAWNKAGGKVVKGLDNRRKAERALCKQGI